jgi:probable biosynthetic protein (TIGR04098 family)
MSVAHPIVALRARARPLPEAPRRVRVGMPQLDAGGLSEGWLLRYAGDLHWEAIGRRLGVPSDEIVGEEGERLYPTVIAVRARYGAALAAVRENDVLETTAEVMPCGRACAHGRVVATFGGGEQSGRLTLELLTTFAVRAEAGALRMALPAARLAARWTPPPGPPPAIAVLARAARRGEPLDDAFSGLAPARTGRPLDEIVFEPSPYADYNGAGLLYFASYATIADTAERLLARRLGLARACQRETRGLDWALATSAARRDVFYYDNLPLGAPMVAALMSFDRDAPDGDGGGVTTHVRLARAQGGRTMADVVTRRRFVAGTR